MIVHVHEAQTELSKLLARAGAGEENITSRAGAPAARLLIGRALARDPALVLIEARSDACVRRLW